MKHIKSLLSLLVLISIIYAQCTKDIECKGNRICVDGQCVDSAPKANTETNFSGKSNLVGPFSLYAQPLGFLQVGPIVGMEVRLFQNLLLDLHYRYSALGIVYVAIATGGFEDDLKMNSMGFGGGLRYLIPTPGPHNPYAGATYEFDYSEGTYGEEDDGGEWKTTSMGFTISGGFRWRFGKSFYLGVGGSLGALFVTDYEKSYSYNNGPITWTYEPDDDSYVLPMIELFLGWELGRK